MAGKEAEPSLCVLRIPTAHRVGPVRSRDKCVIQERFDRFLVSKSAATQLSRIAQVPYLFSWARIIDDASQAYHQR
jgi:hypothetical protein